MCRERCLDAIASTLSLLTIFQEGEVHMNLNGGGRRNMAQPTSGGEQVDPQLSEWFSYLKVVVGVLVMGGLFTGCVSSEKYEAEKARALNFQRL